MSVGFTFKRMTLPRGNFTKIVISSGVVAAAFVTDGSAAFVTDGPAFKTECPTASLVLVLVLVRVPVLLLVLVPMS